MRRERKAAAHALRAGIVAATLISACGSEDPAGSSGDAGVDADGGRVDGAAVDGATRDAGGGDDAGAPDAGPAPDASTPDGGVGDGGAGDGGTVVTPSACALPAPFDEGLTYARTLHVATTGSASGDGSAARPFDTIARALAAATPGTRILVAAGRYGRLDVGSRSGAPGRPIAIVADGEVTIDGSGGTGISVSDASWLVLEGLTIAGSSVHGMNIDDGGSFDTPAHHIVLRNLRIPSAGSGGNNDCIKMSGVDDFWVLGSDVARCDRGEAIDMVGCHRGVIHGNVFHDVVGSGVQAKGGSADVLIHGNVFADIPSRAVNAGGSTGLEFFRPVDAPYEAARIRVLSNVFARTGAMSGAAIAYVGCDGCVAAHNTIVAPRTWVARILQESTQPRFVPCRDGVFANNVVVLDAADIRTVVNVGAGTAPETFTFRNNLFFAVDQGAGWRPPYAGVPAETGGIYQRDPLMVDRAGGDYRLRAGSPAQGAAAALGMPLPPDLDGRCYADAATLGAFEIP
jgi:hypothetical protein